MDVALPHKGRGMHAVFPFTHEPGLRVVHHCAGQLGFVGHDELDVLGLIDLVRPGELWLISQKACCKRKQKECS